MPPRLRSGVRAPRPRLRRGSRRDVTRDEFDRLVAFQHEQAAFMDDLKRELEVQFERIAQIQAELDLLKRAWARLPGARRSP
jgi:hypothetical protein